MPGMPGRSGGSNRMTAAEHEVRGTHRPSRHGGNSTAVRTNWAERLAAIRPDDRGQGWRPTPAHLSVLDKAGKRVVREWLNTYAVSLKARSCSKRRRHRTGSRRSARGTVRRFHRARTPPCNGWKWRGQRRSRVCSRS